MLGGLRITYLMWVILPLLIFACLFSYHQAVLQKQQKPFPSATITANACHYPQDIIFRFFMCCSGAFVSLMYFTLFNWLQLVKKDIGWPHSTQSCWLHPLGQISIIGFYCAVATIDGKGTTPIHGPGAVAYFIVLFLIVGAVTIVMTVMDRWKGVVMSQLSKWVKIGIFGYLLAVTLYCIIGLLTQKEDLTHDDKYVVIIEWNLALGGMLWLLTFVLDWNNIQLVLKGDYEKTVKMIV